MIRRSVAGSSGRTTPCELARRRRRGYRTRPVLPARQSGADIARGDSDPEPRRRGRRARAAMLPRGPATPAPESRTGELSGPSLRRRLIASRSGSRRLSARIGTRLALCRVGAWAPTRASCSGRSRSSISSSLRHSHLLPVSPLTVTVTWHGVPVGEMTVRMEDARVEVETLAGMRKVKYRDDDCDEMARAPLSRRPIRAGQRTLI